MHGQDRARARTSAATLRLRLAGTSRSRRAILCAAALFSTASASPRALPAGPAAWRAEAADPAARVVWRRGTVEIDTRGGLTLWYTHPLAGRIAIDFDALMVSAGGANDRVSDLNAFWMATDPAALDGSPVGRRAGVFEDYDTLRTYYVGIGGNTNSSTRLRRYVGRAGDRPLLPQHDLSDPAVLLRPNVWTHVRLVADGGRIAVERDGRAILVMADAAPYTRGWFGLRTTWSHLKVRNIRITHL